MQNKYYNPFGTTPVYSVGDLRQELLFLRMGINEISRRLNIQPVSQNFTPRVISDTDNENYISKWLPVITKNGWDPELAWEEVKEGLLHNEELSSIIKIDDWCFSLDVSDFDRLSFSHHNGWGLNGTFIQNRVLLDEYNHNLYRLIGKEPVVDFKDGLSEKSWNEKNEMLIQLKVVSKSLYRWFERARFLGGDVNGPKLSDVRWYYEKNCLTPVLKIYTREGKFLVIRALLNSSELLVTYDDKDVDEVKFTRERLTSLIVHLTKLLNELNDSESQSLFKNTFDFVNGYLNLNKLKFPTLLKETSSAKVFSVKYHFKAKILNTDILTDVCVPIMVLVDGIPEKFLNDLSLNPGRVMTNTGGVGPDLGKECFTVTDDKVSFNQDRINSYVQDLLLQNYRELMGEQITVTPIIRQCYAFPEDMRAEDLVYFNANFLTADDQQEFEKELNWFLNKHGFKVKEIDSSGQIIYGNILDEEVVNKLPHYLIVVLNNELELLFEYLFKVFRGQPLDEYV